MLETAALLLGALVSYALQVGLRALAKRAEARVLDPEKRVSEEDDIFWNREYVEERRTARRNAVRRQRSQGDTVTSAPG